MRYRLKTTAEIEAMRTGGAMLATVLEQVGRAINPGITAIDLAILASSELKKLGGEPAFLGYQGFPDVICISVNEQVQHAIPDQRPLQLGDVVNLDFGVRYKGMITDGGRSFGVGKVSADTQRLLNGTEEALRAAIKTIRAGVEVESLSAAIEDVLTKYRLGIVRTLVGHGVGHQLHEEPEIPNYRLHRPNSPRLLAGMTIAVEPITTLGGEAILQQADGWTLVTKDGSWSAQFEHTILVTETGAEILTITS